MMEVKKIRDLQKEKNSLEKKKKVKKVRNRKKSKI
jgi:hypothetical protein